MQTLSEIFKDLKVTNLSEPQRFLVDATHGYEPGNYRRTIEPKGKGFYHLKTSCLLARSVIYADFSPEALPYGPCPMCALNEEVIKRYRSLLQAREEFEYFKKVNKPLADWKYLIMEAKHLVEYSTLAVQSLLLTEEEKPSRFKDFPTLYESLHQQTSELKNNVFSHLLSYDYPSKMAQPSGVKVLFAIVDYGTLMQLPEVIEDLYGIDKHFAVLDRSAVEKLRDPEANHVSGFFLKTVEVKISDEKDASFVEIFNHLISEQSMPVEEALLAAKELI